MSISGIRPITTGVLLGAAGLLAACSTASSRSTGETPPLPPVTSHALAAGSAKASGTSGQSAGTGGSAVSGGTAASGRPWWNLGPPTPCAVAALLRANGRVQGTGTCMGDLSSLAAKITLAVGQQVDVHMTGVTGSESGPHGYPLPHSTRPSVLMPGAVGPDPLTQTFRAVHPGQAVLLDATKTCLIFRHRALHEVRGACPVAVITVVP